MRKNFFILKRVRALKSGSRKLYPHFCARNFWEWGYTPPPAPYNIILHRSRGASFQGGGPCFRSNLGYVKPRNSKSRRMFIVRRCFSGRCGRIYDDVDVYRKKSVLFLFYYVQNACGRISSFPSHLVPLPFLYASTFSFCLFYSK